MKKNLAWPSLTICAIVSGCSTPQQVARPSDITLDNAITQVADSLNKIQIRTANRQKIGLIVDEATVTFNIAASSTNKSTVSADLSAAPLVGGKAGLSISNELTNQGNRGNTITVVFKNMGTADYTKGGPGMIEYCRHHPQIAECIKIMSRPNLPTG
ncbi:hypothetical protein [Phyllobacterium calauticae]|uniref:hypothetical protein n=1 Tax=Phyllobacterium calauticae TaxID=2817027 RepID=UPI001CBD1567|nr:hypothetical protein [Phyllobacterium calauticae]MBZ3696000.1 hypothetical protein [Phyllobacterium calauticae]